MKAKNSKRANGESPLILATLILVGVLLGVLVGISFYSLYPDTSGLAGGLTMFAFISGALLWWWSGEGDDNNDEEGEKDDGVRDQSNTTGQ